MRIFVVDDEENIRSILKRSLEKEGFLVSQFENGRDAYESVNYENPDLIVLDWDIIISRKSGQKIQKIANLQYYKSKANYGTKKKGISR